MRKSSKYDGSLSSASKFLFNISFGIVFTALILVEKQVNSFYARKFFDF
jgi:hypothetical protein